MQRDLAGDGDAAFIGAEVVGAGREAEGIGEVSELAAGAEVEFAFGVLRHRRRACGNQNGRYWDSSWGALRERGRENPAARALSRQSGFTRLPAVLCLSGGARRHRWRVQASSPASARNSAIRSDGFAENAVGGDQHRHAAEPVGAHLRTVERDDRGDVAQRRRAAHDVLENQFPGRAAEVEIDLGLFGRCPRQALGDAGVSLPRRAVNVSTDGPLRVEPCRSRTRGGASGIGATPPLAHQT